MEHITYMDLQVSSHLMRCERNRLEVIDIGQVLVGWAEEPYSRV
jgi:hypothetical protein